MKGFKVEWFRGLGLEFTCLSMFAAALASFDEA